MRTVFRYEFALDAARSNREHNLSPELQRKVANARADRARRISKEGRTAQTPTTDSRERATALKDQGNACHKKGKQLEAARFCTLAIAFDDESTVYFTNRAAFWIDLRRWNDAVMDGETALAIDSDNVRVRLAKAYLAMRMSAESLSHGKEGIELLERQSQLTPREKTMHGGLKILVAQAEAMEPGGGEPNYDPYWNRAAARKLSLPQSKNLIQDSISCVWALDTSHKNFEEATDSWSRRTP